MCGQSPNNRCHQLLFDRHLQSGLTTPQGMNVSQKVAPSSLAFFNLAPVRSAPLRSAPRKLALNSPAPFKLAPRKLALFKFDQFKFVSLILAQLKLVILKFASLKFSLLKLAELKSHFSQVLSTLNLVSCVASNASTGVAIKANAVARTHFMVTPLNANSFNIW